MRPHHSYSKQQIEDLISRVKKEEAKLAIRMLYDIAGRAQDICMITYDQVLNAQKLNEIPLIHLVA